MDDVAQQLSDIRIDESSCISVGGFIFELSEYANMKELAKALKDELIYSSEDVPLHFFGKGKDCIIASKKVGSLTNKMYGEIEARYKDTVWPLVFS